MFKKKLIAVMMSAFCLAAAVPSVPAMADGQKVVTLGADLTEDQRNMILKYFGVYGESIETLTITNEDEREHLGSYIPLEQIGTRTYSCALVSPTTSGGIQVKTANLTYVTSNMIASTLSTSGVVNCDVLAAAPFAVSGTGALTGILMAYETASGETLDEEKKETATQELVTTTSIANNIGQVEATQIVNETKIQVIENNVDNSTDIEVIVNEVVEEEDITISDEDRALLVELLEKIAEQDYNYDEMSETLERVEENLNELMSESTSDGTEAETSSDTIVIGEETEAALASDETDVGTDAASTDEAASATDASSALAEDSILLNTDDSALGSDVLFDATDESALTETQAADDTSEQTEAAVAETGEIPTDASGDDSGLEITVSDSYSDTADSQAVTDSSETSADAVETEAADTGAESEADIIVDTVESEAFTAADLTLYPDAEDYAADTRVVAAGLNYLTVSSERTDLAAGSGTVSIYNATDGSLIETVQMNDETRVVSEQITDIEKLTELGWTEGVEFRIYLGSPLAQNTSYFVLLGDDAFTLQDGAVSLQASTDSLDWYFGTWSYGIGLVESVNGITVGTAVTGNIYMDTATSSYAVIDSVTVEGADVLADTISVTTMDQTEFTENGSFQITFGETGETVIHVSYYDSADTMNLVNEASYTVTVK